MEIKPYPYPFNQQNQLINAAAVSPRQVQVVRRSFSTDFDKNATTHADLTYNPH